VNGEPGAGDAVRVLRDGPVTTVLISRPERRNAVDGAIAAALAGAFRGFDADPDAAVAVLYGEGGTFCSGADLRAAGTEQGNRVSADGEGPMGPTRMRLSKPVIAAVEGHAVAGGLELALWCDLRIATEGSMLGFPERRWGVPLIDGGTQRLPHVVGLGRALDLILTGRMIDAGEAAAIGLVNEVVPAGAHLERSLALAEGLAHFPQSTMLADRRAALEGLGLTLADGLALEAQAGPEVFEDGARGAARFAAGAGRGGAGAGA
jgi:enoyl-CoA hydratase/carnithine racemase